MDVQQFDLGINSDNFRLTADYFPNFSKPAI